MDYGIQVNDATGAKIFGPDDLLMRTMFSQVVTLSGNIVTVSLPGFDPAKGFVVVTYFNGGLPDYIPLPEYRILGAVPNVYVEIRRKYSGQRDQPMNIWAAHYR